MTSKDLHLSLDPELIQLKTDPSDQPVVESAPTEATAQPEQPNSPARGVIGTRLVVGIVILNISFLALAGYWLAEYTGKQPFPFMPSSIVSEFDDRKKIKELDSKLIGIQQQLDRLELSVGEQKHLISSGHLDLSEQLQSSTPDPVGNTKPAAPVALAPAKLVQSWHINLGTFHNREIASKLQQQHREGEHQAQMETIKIEGKAAYRVQLLNYKDRNSAELTANKMMSESGLTGLWVGKSN
jgi:hypothetical protein